MITFKSTTMSNSKQATYSLWELIRYFFYLGYAGFGGPVALVGYMHRDLVEKRRWVTEDEYREGMALAQLSPGPLAAQLGIYLGFVHYGVLGATATGIAFVLPSFIMVLALGIAYEAFGGLAWMQSIFYGVGAAVVGIIGVSACKLTVKSVGGVGVNQLLKNGLLWLLYVLGLSFTVVTQREEVLLFIGAGAAYMMVKAPPRWMHLSNKTLFHWAWFLPPITWTTSGETLWQIALFFAKAGAFVFGSGLAIVPFLHGGVVHTYGWLTEKEFLDAVAVAMITPGPVVITVGFIGYLVGGVTGACVAALATFLPCYLLTVLPAPYFSRIAKNQSVRAFVDGVTASVIGALTGAVMIIAFRTFMTTSGTIDFVSIGLAFITVVFLLRYKLKEPLLIGIAAILGLALKAF